MSGDVPMLAAVEAALTAILNRVLALDAGAAARLRRIEGRVLAIELRDVRGRMYVVATAGRLELLRDHGGHVDVTIRGRPADFVALARANRRGESLGAGRIEIAGDLAVAQDVQALLAELDLDPDEWLAGYLGDANAHRVGRVARGAIDAARRGGAKFERDLGEYLREELRAVPGRVELDAFGRAVFELDDAVARAEARLGALSQRRGVRG